MIRIRGSNDGEGDDISRRLRRTGAAGGAGAAAGLAIATIVLPQLTDIAGPTALLTLLVTLLLALTGACVQRWLAFNGQLSSLENALRVWPPQPLATTKLAALGVYPVSQAGGGRYQPRSEDRRLDQALAEAEPIVVHGPARCGKSRAAREAACRAFGDIPAIVPVDADGLRWLADHELDVKLPSAEVCLWLDGLDRFFDVLNVAALESLTALSSPKVRLVTTIRTHEWNSLLADGGQQCEAARALSEASEVIELGSLPELPEQGAGGEDGEREGSRALAAGGDATAVADPVPDMPHSPWSDNLFRGLLVAVLAVAASTAAIGFTSDWRTLVKPPPIADQINQTIDSMLAHGGHVVVNERLRLHSTEQDSWVVVVEDEPTSSAFYAGATGTKGAARPRSDELRIYDVSGGWLRLKLDFRPRGRGRTARDWVQPAGAPPALDYNNDGTREIIAGYSIPDAHSELLPFAIHWDENQYKLVSMTPEAPELGTTGFGKQLVTLRDDLYLKRVSLGNAISGSSVNSLDGYQVQGFALTQTPTVRLITGYYAGMPQYGASQVLELRANQIEHSDLGLQPCTPDSFSCPAPAHEEDVVIPAAKTLDNGLLQGWQQTDRRWLTPVKVRERRRWECLQADAGAASATSSGCPEPSPQSGRQPGSQSGPQSGQGSAASSPTVASSTTPSK